MTSNFEDLLAITKTHIGYIFHQYPPMGTWWKTWLFPFSEGGRVTKKIHVNSLFAQNEKSKFTHGTPSGRALRVVPRPEIARIDSNELSLISSQSDQVQACKYVHLMSNFVKNHSIISLLTEMPYIVHSLIDQFFESTTRSRTVIDPKIFGSRHYSTRKR